MIRTLFALCVASVTLVFHPMAAAENEPAQKAVLVTGASSGLGRVMAEAMAAKGYFVYAGARKDADLAELDAIENIQAIRLDVNKQDQIDAAVKTIREAGRGLYGLVNNAGVVVISPLIDIEEDDFHFQMNVNIYGVYRVTRAFAPLIIDSKGRISVIGSISGTISGATWGPYAMTKHAMEAYADALAEEMQQFGVHVSLIEPGAYRSQIGKTALERMEEQDQSAEGSRFEKQMTDSMNWLTHFEKDAGDPTEVAEVVMMSLFDDNPKPRYMIVPNQEQAYWTINRAIERMVEQNSDHRFSYDRAQLIEMLDAALAKETGNSGRSVPVPREIIDLGALVTEQTPEEFWGNALLEEMEFHDSNAFDVLERTFGPLSVSNSYYRLFNHGGPHVDAPIHVGLGEGIDSFSVESFAGPLKVFDFSHLPIGRTITKEMLLELPIDAGDIVLTYTGFSLPENEAGWPQAIALGYEAATYLANLPVRAIGTDALNVESMTDQSPVPSEDEVARVIPGHHAFLSKGIPVFEQLVNVDKLIGRNSMYFVGAPLNIKDGDGMMVRPLVLVY